MWTPPHESLVNAVHDDELFNVWQSDPGLITHAAALTGDPVLAAFAETLDESFKISDLRDAPIGMGFAWGRHGPDSHVLRHGLDPIFAVAPSERAGRGLRGMLRRRR